MQVELPTLTPPPRGERPRVGALPVAMAALGLMALLAPLGAAEQPLQRVGVLLAIVGALEIQHGVRRVNAAAMRQAVRSGVITVAMALLVINAPYLAGTALVLFLSISFAIDAVGYIGMAWRSTERRERLLTALAAIGDTTAAVLLMVVRHFSVNWLVAGAGAARALGIAWNMASAPVHATDEAGQ